MTSKVGYVKLHRAIMENDMYFEEPFSRIMAWLDLILLANHKDNIAFIRGNSIEVKKGQLAYAVKTLAARWKWSRSKVDRFLLALENRAQIEHQKNSLTTIITIINWEKYQIDEHKTNTKRTSNEHQTNTNNNDKEYIKNNIESIDTRALNFKDQVAEFISVYPKTMLREFYDYWTEKNQTGKKLRYETEKTFEVSKRLANWAKRENTFKSKEKPAQHLQTALSN